MPKRKPAELKANTVSKAKAPKAPITDNQAITDPFPTSLLQNGEDFNALGALGVPAELANGKLGTEPVSSANPDEKNEKNENRTQDEAPITPPITDQANGKNDGDIVIESQPSELDSSVSSITREESQAEATRRWRNEGIAERVAAFRDRVREEYRVAHPKCKRRDAHDHAWSRAMAEFPAGGSAIPPSEAPVEPIAAAVPVQKADVQTDGSVSGLSNFPPSWPPLPANAQLQQEIAWVTANRLLVRDGTGVNLSRAMSPPPSYSTLSWLETSILFPSKFAEISVKASATQDDEKEFIKREKLAVEEIRSILKEMLDAKG